MYFGIYLLRRGMITLDEFLAAIDRQAAARPRIGTLALKTGKMTVNQTFQVMDRQAKTGEPFGRIAVELGFLSESDVAELLISQRRGHQPLGQYLVEMGAISAERLATERDRYVMDKAEHDATRPSTTNVDGGDLAEMVAIREARGLVAELRQLMLEGRADDMAQTAEHRSRQLCRLVQEIICPGVPT